MLVVKNVLLKIRKKQTYKNMEYKTYFKIKKDKF